MPFSRTFQAWKSQHCNSRTFQGLYEPCLSGTPHVQHLVTSNAQVLYALKILRAHSLRETAIQAIFHSVILVRFYMPHMHSWALLEPKITESLRISAP